VALAGKLIMYRSASLGGVNGLVFFEDSSGSSSAVLKHAKLVLGGVLACRPAAGWLDSTTPTGTAS